MDKCPRNDVLPRYFYFSETIICNHRLKALAAPDNLPQLLVIEEAVTSGLLDNLHDVGSFFVGHLLQTVYIFCSHCSFSVGTKHFINSFQVEVVLCFWI